MEKNDAKAATIGQYLAKLTREVWEQEEGFSGKRPFGNSGWKHEIAKTLIVNNYIEGEVDSDGYIEDYVDSQYEAIMTGIFDLFRDADYSTLAPTPAPKDWRTVYVEFNNQGKPVIADYYIASYTQEEAEKQAADDNDPDLEGHWIAIPQK